MPADFSRRSFFHVAAGTGILAQARAQQPASGAAPTPPEPVYEYKPRSAVALVKGENRRKNVTDALTAIDEQIRPELKRKKYVIIKPNNVSAENPLASTSADAILGILDYLAPRFKLPIVIAESSSGDTMKAFENFRYTNIAAEHRDRKVSLVDLNAEAKYKVLPLIDYHLHIQRVRLAARLFDPDAFIICSAILKTHNAAIATLSVKNMVLGAPLHQSPKETARWSDKRKYHAGIRQMHYNMVLTAQAMQPFWGATVIDGFEGMEGNGPASGTPVPSRIAIASTDYLAADRVGVECMGIDAGWPGYLAYCGQLGLGNYDLAKIDIRGEAVAAVKKPYRMHKDIERELQWMGPMTDLPPKLG